MNFCNILLVYGLQENPTYKIMCNSFWATPFLLKFVTTIECGYMYSIRICCTRAALEHQLLGSTQEALYTENKAHDCLKQTTKNPICQSHITYVHHDHNE